MQNTAPQAIMIRCYGGPEVLEFEEVTVAAPGPGELRLRQTAVGVNFHDIYVRSGLYKTLSLPGIPGCEAAGVVEAVGEGVADFRVGDRAAYVVGPPYGAYASHRILPASKAVPLPDHIDDSLAAANLLRALTVDMLTNRVAHLEPGMTVLVHAAAGGVGRLLCQMASSMGVTVLGTVGSPDKAEIAKASGCAAPILYRDVAFQDEALRLTDGRGVDVVYDSIGADTFSGSLKALAKCGHLVNFGQSSGPVDPLAMSTLAEKSLTVSRPILFHYIDEPSLLRQMAKTAFDAFGAGILKADPPAIFPLSDAAGAHELLNSRRATTGVVLRP